MTVHQQDSSQPQQSHDSPQVGLIGFGLMMEVIEEVVLPFMVICGGRFLCEVLVSMYSMSGLMFSWVCHTERKSQCGVVRVELMAFGE